MPGETPAAGKAPASRPALAASAVAALSAVIALDGWVAPALGLSAPGVAMAPLNALAVLLLAGGVAAAAARTTLRGAATAAALAAAAIGAAIIAAHLLGADALLTAAGAARRPAALTAGAILALAIALLLARRDAAPVAVHLLAGGSAAVALLALVAAVYGLWPPLAPPAWRGITIAAAIALLALAAGVELVRPGRGLAGLWAAPGIAGSAARRLLAAAVLVPVAAGWLALLGQRAGFYGAPFALSLAVVASTVVLWGLIAKGARGIERRDARRSRAEHAHKRALHVERRGRRTAERRWHEEEALRGVAQTLSAAFDLRSILQAIAEGATAAAQADGVYVERRRGPDEVEVVAAAGSGAPPPGTRVPYPGSLTEAVVRSRETEILEDIALDDRPISRHLARSCGHCRALIAPWFSEDEPIGALVLLRHADRSIFTEDEIARIELFAGIASLALRRGLLVAEAQRRRREAEASEQRFRSLVELNPDAVFSLDPQGRCTSANPAAEALTGFAETDMVGEPFAGVVAPEHRVRAWRAFRRALHGLPQRIELEIQPRHGDRREVRIGLLPMVGHDSAIGVFGVAEDVTERRRAERELHAARAEAERRARADAALRRAAETVASAFTDEDVIDAIAEGALIATGADGAFVERFADGGKDLVVATVTGEWTPELGARRPYAGSFGEAVLLRGAPVAVERAREAGHPLTPGFAERCGDCGLLGVPLVDAGQTLGVLLLVRAPDRPPFTPDQHARALTFSRLASLAFRKVHLLEDSERRREELEYVLESRSRLVRGFSHDVKNPIGAADGQAALLEEGTLGDLDEQQIDGVRRIRRSLNSALSLIDDLVSLARTEVGEVEIVLKPTDVRVIVRDMGEEYRAQAAAAGLDIEIAPPPALHPIPADAGRVRQILGNLVSNAVKYTPEGGRIAIRVATHDSGPHGEEGQWVAVDVTDTGPGIPEDKQEEIFREFTRLEPGVSTGAGLGLSISRRLARAMGGDVTVRSAPGRGSTFTLWLPASGPLGRVGGAARGARGAANRARPRAARAPGTGRESSRRRHRAIGAGRGLAASGRAARARVRREPARAPRPPHPRHRHRRTRRRGMHPHVERWRRAAHRLRRG